MQERSEVKGESKRTEKKDGGLGSYGREHERGSEKSQGEVRREGGSVSGIREGLAELHTFVMLSRKKYFEEFQREVRDKK